MLFGLLLDATLLVLLGVFLGFANFPEPLGRLTVLRVNDEDFLVGGAGGVEVAFLQLAGGGGEKNVDPFLIRSGVILPLSLSQRDGLRGANSLAGKESSARGGDARVLRFVTQSSIIEVERFEGVPPSLSFFSTDCQTGDDLAFLVGDAGLCRVLRSGKGVRAEHHSQNQHYKDIGIDMACDLTRAMNQRERVHSAQDSCSFVAM